MIIDDHLQVRHVDPLSNPHSASIPLSPERRNSGKAASVRLGVLTVLTDHSSGDLCHYIPSGKRRWWKINIFNGKTHYKWQFSIAFCMFFLFRCEMDKSSRFGIFAKWVSMLVYQRFTISIFTKQIFTSEYGRVIGKYLQHTLWLPRDRLLYKVYLTIENGHL